MVDVARHFPTFKSLSITSNQISTAELLFEHLSLSLSFVLFYFPFFLLLMEKRNSNLRERKWKKFHKIKLIDLPDFTL